MRTQTIPDSVLDKITRHRPHLKSIVDNLRSGRCPAAQAEKALANSYLLGETRLTGIETWRLSHCCTGGIYAG